MNVGKLLVDFAITFAVTLVVAALVTLLYNLIAHGTGMIDWETAFQLAVILGIAIPLSNSRLAARQRSGA